MVRHAKGVHTPLLSTNMGSLHARCDGCTPTSKNAGMLLERARLDVPLKSRTRCGQIWLRSSVSIVRVTRSPVHPPFELSWCGEDGRTHQQLVPSPAKKGGWASDVTRVTSRPAKEFHLWMDRAPSHTSKVVQAAATRLFRSLILQPGKSPDMNMLDAGVFPTMERRVERLAAKDVESIERAVESVWTALTSETLRKVAQRVRRNLKEVKHRKGGNFYAE